MGLADPVIEVLDVVVPVQRKLCTVPFSEASDLKIKPKTNVLQLSVGGLKKTGLLHKNSNTHFFYTERHGNVLLLHQLSGIVYLQNNMLEKTPENIERNIRVTYNKKETEKQREARMKNFSYLNKKMKQESWIQLKIKNNV